MKRHTWIAVGLIVAGIAGLMWSMSGRKAVTPNAPMIGGFENASVVVITTDTTRADRLGCYGSTAGLTPNIDALAERGILFEHTQAVAPVTLPSHTSMFTGLYPTNHGVRNNGMFSLPSGVQTLAEQFSKSGYATGAFVSAQVLIERYGLDRGFEIYDDDLSKSLKIGQTMVPSRRGNFTVDEALKWLDGIDSGRPVFLWVHLYDPHAPYDPPAAYREKYPSDPYGGEIAFVDDLVQRVVDSLRESGRWDNTVFTVISDHGEAFGEHDEATHGILLHQATTRVPWIIVTPSSDRPIRVSQPVSGADLAPVLAGLAGIEPPNADRLDGLNLFSRNAGDQSDQRAIYSEAMLPMFQYGWSSLRGIRQGPWQVISGVRDELFNIDRDPRELTDLAESEPLQVQHLLEKIDRIKAHDDVHDDASALEVSPSEREALEALGYAVGSTAPRANPLDPRDIIQGHVHLEQSRSLLSAGRVDEALASVEAMLQGDPENLAALSLKTRAFLTSGRLKEAEDVATYALELDPNSSDTLLTLSRIEMARGAYDRVIDIAEVGRNSRSPFGVFDAMHARALLAQKKLNEAEAVVARALESLPNDPDLLTVSASANSIRGNTSESERLLRQAVELDPFHRAARRMLAQILRNSGRADEAVSVYQDLLAISPGDPDALLAMGSAYLDFDPSQAVPYLEEVARVAPGNALGLTTLGIAYIKTNRIVEAEATLRRATTLDPDNHDIRNNLGIVLIQKGAPEEAARELNRIVSSNPRHFQARNNLAIALGRANDLDGALREAKAALDVKPDFVDAMLTLASIYNIEKRADDEFRILDRAYGINPERFDVSQQLVVASESVGRCGRALEIAPRLEPMLPALSPDVHVALGTCLEAAGDEQRALRHFEDAVRKIPTSHPLKTRAEAGIQRISLSLGEAESH